MLRINFALLLVLLAARFAFADPITAQSAQAVDVSYKNGSVNLAALLMLPASEGAVPAVVIAQGSGTSDRSNHWSREIAEEFVRHGVAALLTDKRGSGASSGDWRTASFSDLAEDVRAGVEFLRGRSDINSERIGVVGLSQGGQVAPIAAAGFDHIAFVISISSKTVGFAEGSFIEMANTARQAGLSEPDVDEVLKVNRAALRYLTGGTWDQYIQARKHALQSDAREIAAGFPAERDQPIWIFLRSVAAYDPLAYWVQVSQPTLFVYGKEDERDNTPVEESVRRLDHAFRSANKRDYRVLVVPDAGHGIRDPKTHQLARRFTDTLAAWLQENALRH